MKINTFLIVLIFSILVSISIEIYENDETNNKFLPKSHNQKLKIDNSLLGYVSNQIEERYESTMASNDTDSPKTDGEETEKKTYVNIKCLFVSKYDVYSLQKLTKDKGYSKEMESGELKFNFCKDLDGFNSTVVFDKNETQVLFAGSINGSEKSKNEWLAMDEDSGEKGVKIRLAEGDRCKEDRKHMTVFKIYCDDTIPDDEFEKHLNFSDFDEKGCTHYITGRSIYGCALNDWYLLRRLMNEYNYVFATLLILIGLFLALFGERCETPTLIIVTAALLCYFVTVIILSFIPSLIKTEKNLWILLGVSAAAGGIIGIFLKKKLVIFGVIVGACGGYTSAEFVYQFIAQFISINPQVLYWVVVGVCVLIGGFLGYWAVKAAIIIGTSIIGGYIAMRGLTLIFKNYMELAEFVDLVKNGEFEELKNIKSYWTYAYLGFWIVLTLAGCYYQCWGYKKREKNNSNKVEGNKDNKNYKKM